MIVTYMNPFLKDLLNCLGNISDGVFEEVENQIETPIAMGLEMVEYSVKLKI